MTKLIMYSLVLIIAVYSAVDAYQTKLLLSLGAKEANPILATLIHLCGFWPGIIAFKAFFIALLSTALAIFFRRSHQDG